MTNQISSEWEIAVSSHPHKHLPGEQESLALGRCSQYISLALFQTSTCEKQNK